MKCLLSIVIPSRNDKYMGNSNWRLETVLNFFAKVLEKIGRLNDVEFVIVDWGSDIPLHSVLSLTKQAKQITRFLLIPSSVTEKVGGDSDYPDSIALNVGLRRSFGQFISQSAIDVLWAENFFYALFKILDGKKKIKTPLDKTLFIFSRKHIPWEIVNKNPTLSFLDEYIRKNGNKIPVDPFLPYLLAPAGTVIMHRDLWFECRGYDEKLIYWGWNDIDLNTRIRLKYFYLDMGRKEGMHVYHLQHYAPGGPTPLRFQKHNPHVFGPFIANGKDWGLANYQFKEVPSIPPLDVSNLTVTTSSKNNRFFREKHILNVMKFAMTNPGWRNFSMALSVIKRTLASSPESNIYGRLYSRISKIIPGKYL